MTDVIAFVIALGFGFGLSLWIFSTFLEKSNNIGDSVGGRSAYKAYAKFTVPQPKGDELVRRRMPTEIASEQHISVEELDQLREKRFAMRDTPYEQQGSLDDLHGVFGKIDEE